jgi:hypothetical protein
MKVGDKIRYKGGMNPECKAYKYIQFDKEYEIVNIDGSFIDVVLDKSWLWCFKFTEIIEMFTRVIKASDIHYNNTNGSLYLFANQHELNAYEFDIIKRIVRCRKKGQFREDLEKTIRVIELYLKEVEL